VPQLRAATPSEPPVPSRIGRYEILGLVGRGAMGVVYKARDPLLDRVVAVKTISAPAALGARVRKAFLERFEREAKAAAGISHPAIVTIFDVGFDHDSPFLVMEFLPGETLADRLDRERVPLPVAVECARELASALGSAHRLRIVHRDVKPANVLYAGDGRWKLADFGIARLPDSDLTQLGTFMGTPGYSPPEAIREGRYTVQADVFAWGALFYELLCGRIPYEGPDTETTNKKVMAAEAPSPCEHDPSIPTPLAEVAVRALAHDPAVRYADGAAVAAALSRAWHEAITSGAVPVSLFAALATTPPLVAASGAAASPPPPSLPPAAPPPARDARPPARALPTERDAGPPLMTEPPEPPAPREPAIVREQHSTARDDVATLIRTGAPRGAPVAGPRLRSLRRRRRARAVIVGIVALVVVAVVLLLVR
jgi:serine/threonine-protein kinase